jgi:hypothetical protein
MRFLSAETAVGEIGVEPAVGLTELSDRASKFESVALLLKDLVCWFPREPCFYPKI